MKGGGICYTRTGRRFFNDPALEAALLARVRAAMEVTGLWETLSTDWICLDCELLPWSAKAQALLRQQYAAVGSAARAALAEAVAVLEQLEVRAVPGETSLLPRYRARAMVADYVAAYRRYCWEVCSVDDLKLAPFHVLATEGMVHVQHDHVWHLETLASLCRADLQPDSGVSQGSPLLATPTRWSM